MIRQRYGIIRKRGRQRGWCARMLCCMALILSLSGCGSVFVSETAGSEGYTDAQVMLIVATERNRYREVYTDQIWTVSLGEGVTFQEYWLQQIRNFLSELKTMNLLADEQGIGLTGQEKEKIRSLADMYYESLTLDDLAYMRVSREDVRTMYEEYCRANKLVDVLTQDVDLEISDSEAKVITVQEICLETRQEAQEIWKKVVLEKEDFLEATADSLETEHERSIGRGERGKEYEKIAFSLEQGQIGEPVEENGLWYVIRCVNDYDQDATQKRKERLAVQRKNQAFRRIYDAFALEHPVRMQGALWETIRLSDGERSATTNFFSLYHEMMDQ